MDWSVRIEDTVHATKETAQAKVDEVKQHLQKSSETLQDKADEATLQAKKLTNQALARLPAPVSRRIHQRSTDADSAATAGARCSDHAGCFVLLMLRRLLRSNG